MIEMYQEVDFLEDLLSEVDPSAQRALIRNRRKELLAQISTFEADMDVLYSEMEGTQDA
jgi:hypothetical protein